MRGKPEWINEAAKEISEITNGDLLPAMDISDAVALKCAEIISEHAPPAPQWHPASEPPKDDRMVRGLFADGIENDSCWFDGYMWMSGRDDTQWSNITHWMEKPPLPGEQ